MRRARGVREGLAVLLRLAVGKGSIRTVATAVTGLTLGRGIALGVVPASIEGTIWGGPFLQT